MGLRAKTAAIGVAETPYYRRGLSPLTEAGLALRAIVDACEDAGLDPRDLDGFASYADDRNSGPELMRALGTRELCWSSMVWGGGGGGAAAALGGAAAAIVTGQANFVVVYRAIAERSTGRLQDSLGHYGMSEQYLANGITTPAQIDAMHATRLLETGVPRSTFEAVSRASYFHGSRNPRAVAFGQELTHEAYANARHIVEPFDLYDCSRENDVGIAVILTSAERAHDLRRAPVYLLGVAQGGHSGLAWENEVHYASAEFRGVADRLWTTTGLSAADMDVVQVYDNFTGAAVGTLIDHGFCTPESAGDTLTYDNLVAPDGKLPINTSGGLLAEGNGHGMGLIAEAVRQLRGESSNPVPGARTCLVTGGAMTPLVSSAVFGTADMVAGSGAARGRYD